MQAEACIPLYTIPTNLGDGFSPSVASCVEMLRYRGFMFRFSITITLVTLNSLLVAADKPNSDRTAPLAAVAGPGDYLIDEDGDAGPLPPSLEFHHGSWKFGEGAMIGEQVPTENHMATIKALMAFDQMKVEWKMKFIEPKQKFLFVAWGEAGGHAMDFNFVPDTGEMSLVRPKSKDKDSAVLAKGKITKLDTEWHELTCIHDGPNFTLTIDGVTITAADEAFTRPMGPFFLNGGGFNGAKFLVKDLQVSALPGSPTVREVLQRTPPKRPSTPTKPLPPLRTYHPAPDDRLLSDFEGNDFGTWTTTGDAFGSAPQLLKDCKNRPARAIGERVSNSFRPNDKVVGTLTSPVFRIDRKHLHFLIGGGPHECQTCLNLVVDGKTVRTTTGCGRKDAKQLEIMLWETWDVTEFQGKTAILQAVDSHKGGWGHIQVDQPVLSNAALD